MAPTLFALDASSNVLSGSVTALGPDRDYFTVIVPSGFALSGIILNDYTSSNARAFIGVQQGSTFTVPPTATSPDGLLGYMHFGFDEPILSDLLDDLAVSIPPGFAPPRDRQLLILSQPDRARPHVLQIQLHDRRRSRASHMAQRPRRCWHAPANALSAPLPLLSRFFLEERQPGSLRRRKATCHSRTTAAVQDA